MEQLRDRLLTAGVEPDIVERAIRGVRHGLRLEIVPKDRAATRLGASRLGGSPDLPPGLSWPNDASGQPLGFLGQLDLAEIARIDRRDELPERGLLSMFVGTWIDAEGEPQLDAKVYHFEDPAVLAPSVPPTRASKPVGVRFTRAVFLPPHSSRFMPWDERYAEAFEDVQGLAYQRHSMFGFDRPDENALADDDVLLLRLGYDRAVPYDFVEAAVLHLILPSEALGARRWEAVRAVEGHSI